MPTRLQLRLWSRAEPSGNQSAICVPARVLSPDIAAPRISPTACHAMVNNVLADATVTDHNDVVNASVVHVV